MKKIEQLELNKEYTYPQICEVLGWKVQSGDSKIAQISAIESAYEFYHPLNKKTKQEKKSYKFTKKIKDVVKPSRANNGGGNNTKNIQPMMDYLANYWDGDNEYYSLTNWYCKQLKLLKETPCNIPYKGDETIDYYCNKHKISNQKLFLDYISSAKSILKNIFLTALGYMQKKDLIDYDDGWIFIYLKGKKSKENLATTKLNDIIIKNETIICNDINDKHNLSKKMIGRQNLLIIYSKKYLTDEFTSRKVSAIMEDEKALHILNSLIDEQKDDSEHISKVYPLINYFQGISINSIADKSGTNTYELGIEICNIVRRKTRKELFRKNYINKYTGEIVYTYDIDECMADILTIEDKLFNYFDVNMVDEDYHTMRDEIKDKDYEQAIDDDMEELDILFDGKSLWGEPDPMDREYTLEEILEMPTLDDVKKGIGVQR